jgi:hypothetical protein
MPGVKPLASASTCAAGRRPASSRIVLTVVPRSQRGTSPHRRVVHVAGTLRGHGGARGHLLVEALPEEAADRGIQRLPWWHGHRANDRRRPAGRGRPPGQPRTATHRCAAQQQPATGPTVLFLLDSQSSSACVQRCDTQRRVQLPGAKAAAACGGGGGCRAGGRRECLHHDITVLG